MFYCHGCIVVCLHLSACQYNGQCLILYHVITSLLQHGLYLKTCSSCFIFLQRCCTHSHRYLISAGMLTASDAPPNCQDLTWFNINDGYITASLLANVTTSQWVSCSNPKRGWGSVKQLFLMLLTVETADSWPPSCFYPCHSHQPLLSSAVSIWTQSLKRFSSKITFHSKMKVNGALLLVSPTSVKDGYVYELSC